MMFFKSVIKIGYQGDVGSNSERAALQFVQSQGWDKVKLVPCIDSDGVVKALLSDKVHYGVVARKNVIAGEVKETKRALENIDYLLCESLNLPINHCLCVLPGTKSEEITEIFSHPQALKQTSDFLDIKFPNIKKTEYQDTALAAKDLSLGKIAPTSAVITTMEASKEYSLEVKAQGISNTADNYTNFILIRDCHKIKKSHFVLLLNKYKSEYLIQGGIALFLMISTALHNLFKLDFSSTVSTAMGILGSAFVFLYSDYFKNFVSSKNIGGYWKYKIEQFGSVDLGPAKQEILRLATITFEDGQLSIKGWLPGKSKNILFVSTRTFNSEFSNSNGLVFYEYTTVSESADKLTFQGYVTLEYFLEDGDTEIFRMSGRYIAKSITNGNSAPDSGRMTYTRISKYEFDFLKYELEERIVQLNVETKDSDMKKAA